ncbi:phage tail protein [Clostridium senegalense]
MSKTIGVALTLKDMFSPAIKKAMDNTKNFTDQAKKASNAFKPETWTRNTRKSFGELEKSFNSINNKFNSVAKTALKFGGVIGGVLGGITLKSGFEEAFNMEGFRVQLETATKSTQKASELMVKAVKFANATPFETNEVVQATAIMESYGISSERWLKDVADMAGATNKSIEQATEAMADVAVGEFERLKQFGIKKDQILLESNKRYGEGVVFNAKGQVLDQAKLMDTVQSMMQQKFGGGAEKLANTTKGMLSTISGITKSTMSQILGVMEDGTIKQGSLMDKLRGKIKQVGDALQRWQEDGTIKRIADNFTQGFTKIWNALKKTYEFIKEHETVIKFIIKTALAYMVLIKAVLGVIKVVKTIKDIFSIISGLALSPWILGVVLALAILIPIGIAVYENWDKIKEMAGKLKNKISSAFDAIKTKVSNAWDTIVTSTSNFFSKIWNGISGFFSKIWAGISGFFSRLSSSVGSFFSKAFNKVSNIFGKITGVIKKVLSPIATIIEAIFKGALAVIIVVVSAIWNKISTVFGKIASFVGGIFSKVFNVISNVWNAIKDAIGEKLSAIWNVVTTIWGAIKDAIGDKLSAIWEVVMNKWNSIKEVTSSIFNAIKDVVGSIWDSITEKIGTVIDAIKEVISGGFNAAKDVVVGIFNNMKETVLNIFRGIWDGIKDIINVGIGMINGFIGGVNKVIGKANKVPGVNIGAVNEIPQFASGTQYAPKGLALINEKGGELRQLRGGETIIPADKSRQLLQGKGVGKGLTLNLTIQGNVIGNEAFMEETGQYIYDKVKMALTN